jgi:hypothetical protein
MSPEGLNPGLVCLGDAGVSACGGAPGRLRLCPGATYTVATGATA